MIIPQQSEMWTHSYKQKTGGKQFLDFIKRVVDQKYNDRNIKQIFLILDNVSIHKSNKVKETLTRGIIQKNTSIVFLPTTRSPQELNLIEVRRL